MAAVITQGAVLEQKKLKGPDKYKSALVSTLDSDLKRKKLKIYSGKIGENIL